MRVQHPRRKGKFFEVVVPASAKVGEAILVPLPTDVPLEDVTASAASPALHVASDEAVRVPIAEQAVDAHAAAQSAGRGWSTGGKVAAAAGGAVLVGGLAAAGALLGEHVMEDGWGATAAELQDDFHTVGERISTGAEEAWHRVEGGAVIAGDHVSAVAEDGWHDVVGATEDAGTFLMDLF